jgi:hypothetical protein
MRCLGATSYRYAAALLNRSDGLETSAVFIRRHQRAKRQIPARQRRGTVRYVAQPPVV